MDLHIQSETARLREVVLGWPYSNGPTPKLNETVLRGCFFKK